MFLASALLPALAFLLLTKMHERYFAPVLPFLVLSAAFSPGLWPVYLAVSFAHLANLYHNWWFPRFPAIVTWLSTTSTLDLLIVIFLIGTAITTYRYARQP